MATAVYAIRYAHREGAQRRDNFYGGDPHDAPMPMSYYAWLVRHEGRDVVVDTGFSAEVALRRPGRELLVDPVAVLAQLGVSAPGVEDVVLTHLHFDHVGGLTAFPRARFWIQDAEMSFWTGRYAARAGFRHAIEPDDVVSMVRLNFDGRLRFVDGDAEVAPGITVHRIGGHSAGLQVVRVQTPGGTVVLCSDAAHYYENLERDRPFSTVHSLPDMYSAFARVRELAGGGGVIVPGHDPEVLDRFPFVEGLEGIAVRVDPAPPARPSADTA